MPTSQQAIDNSSQQRMIQICCAFSAVAGAIAWLGLATGITFLASFGNNLIPMAPSTSLLFIAFGITGFLSVNAANSPRAARAARIIAIVSAAIALPLLILSLQNIYLDIEHLGIRAFEHSTSKPVGHMSPITAFSFLGISAAFLTILPAQGKRKVFDQITLWLPILLLAFYTMLSLAYLLGTPLFYSERFIPPAATTSLAFMSLSMALLLLAMPRVLQKDHGSRFNHQSSSKLIIVFIFLVAGILVTGHFYHNKQKENHFQEAGRQLSAVADLKTNELLSWRNERLTDAGLFYNNKTFAQTLEAHFKHPSSAHHRQEVVNWLQNIQKINYDAVFLLDPQGKQQLSFPSDAFPFSPLATRTAQDSIKSGQIVLMDFYRHDGNHKIYLNIMVPIFDPVLGKTPLGVISFRINPDKFLYPYIKRWPNDSSTAETLIVKRDGDDVVYLNELRFDSDVALNRKIPLTSIQAPTVKAVLGQTGIMEGIDYREVPVLAALRHIPDSPWYLVARIDMEEIQKPLNQSLWITVTLIITLLVSAGAVVLLLWKQQTVGNILLNNERLQCIVNVFQFNAPTTQELLDFALNDSLRMTGSIYGYIYYYDEDTQLFTLNSWSHDVMDSCMVVNPQTTYELEKTGIWGEAVRQRKPIMINNFAAPNPLKKGIPDGHVTLTNFLTIPLFNQGRIVAVVGAANKETAYDESDLLQLSLLMDAVWKVAEHKRFEEALQETNEYLENLINYANAPIIVWDSHFKITRLNHAFEALIGQTAGDVYGKTLEILFPEKLVEESMANIRKTLTGERWESVEIAIKHIDGSVRTVLWNSATIFAADRRTPLATIAQGQDITERKHSEEELKQKNIELERFMYTVSHDLKSPLVTISTFLTYLQQDLATDNQERIHQDIGFMRSAADKMEILLSELLELFRVGRIVVNPVEISLNEIYEEAMQLLAGQISLIKATVLTSDRQLMLFGDQIRLVEIWQNLVENAAKYIGDQPLPSIELGVEESNGELIFFVRDNGIGIEPKFHENIFGLFNKLDIKTAGTGLGLALVKRIVETYGGRIWVESEGPGHGSCFRFTLPDAVAVAKTKGDLE